MDHGVLSRNKGKTEGPAPKFWQLVVVEPRALLVTTPSFHVCPFKIHILGKKVCIALL